MARLLSIDWVASKEIKSLNINPVNIAIYPNINDRLKHRSMPIKSYQELIGALKIYKPKFRISILGSPDEKKKLELSFKDNPLVDSIETKFNSIKEFNERIQKEDLLIISDSGPAHFASLINLPTIVFFGPEDPTFFKPLGNHVFPIYKGISCSPCFKQRNFCYSPCKSNLCVQKIQSSDVINAMVSLFPKLRT